MNFSSMTAGCSLIAISLVALLNADVWRYALRTPSCVFGGHRWHGCLAGELAYSVRLFLPPPILCWRQAIYFDRSLRLLPTHAFNYLHGQGL
jgi:hypothetical protein